MKWQPIDTAPKEPYAPVILSDKNTGWVGEGAWHNRAGWYVANCAPTDYWDAACDPTHWQPLPEPPGS